MGCLQVERIGGVTLMTLDRPERRNALNRELRASLVAAVGEFDADPEQRVAVLAGAGPAFCAGADLKELSEGARGTVHMAAMNSTTMCGVGDSPKPWIAAVGGPAVGGGLELALNCDIRVASRAATFALTEVGLGMIPGVAVHQLVRQVAFGDAMWMLLTTERVDAESALRMGLVQKVVDDDPVTTALEIAGRMATYSPGAMRGVKAVAGHWRDHALAESLEYYRQVNSTDTRSDEMIERVAGFFGSPAPAGGPAAGPA